MGVVENEGMNKRKQIKKTRKKIREKRYWLL
jgi:hypothetical protein